MIAYTFAGLPVAEYAKAYDWYVRFLGRPADMFPHATEAVWRLTPMGAIYVVEDAERAGSGLLTLAVDDLGAFETELREREIVVTEISADQGPRRLAVHDPDGNKISLFADPSASRESHA